MPQTFFKQVQIWDPNIVWKDPAHGRHIMTVNLTAEEYMCIALGCKLRANLPNSEFTLQVQSIALFTTPDIDLPSSKYFTNKHLEDSTPIKASYVVYCPYCKFIFGKFNKPQKVIICLTCQKNLAEELMDGLGQFAVLPVRQQFELFLQDQHCRQAITEFSKMDASHMNGRMHRDEHGRGYIEQFHLDLTLAIDGASLYKKIGRGALPAVLFMNNLPLTLHLRFPVLAAIFTGRKEHSPPRHVFLKFMAEEIREMNKNPIDWVDADGVPRSSRAYLTTVICDTPERSAMMAHVHHNTKSSCHFCLAEGETITREAYPDVFKENPLRKTKGTETIPGGRRHPTLVHENPAPWRDSKGRIEMGIKAIELQTQKRNPGWSIRGVKGIPAIYDLPGFDETDSYGGDLLHILFIGIYKDILKILVKGSGKNFHFARVANNFDIFDELLGTMTRCSEAERNAFSLGQYGKFTAYDIHMFALHQTALYCADDELMPDEMVYEILRHLSNVVYLSQYGRMTEEKIGMLEEEIKQFVVKMKAKFREEYFTYKMHVLQHLPTFVRNHGAAHFVDAWNMEKMNLYLRRLTNAPNQEFRQLVQNFILKHHSTAFQNIDTFPENVKDFLKKIGVDHAVFGKKWKTTVILRTPAGQSKMHDLKKSHYIFTGKIRHKINVLKNFFDKYLI